MKLLLPLLLLSSLRFERSWSFTPAAKTSPAFSQRPVSLASSIAVEAPPSVENFRVFSPSQCSDWKSLIPMIPGERGYDVTVHWTCHKEGSKQLAQHCFPNPSPDVQESLQESMQTFQSLCGYGHDRFKARIVSTRGPSGTKCPRWHADHVPMRWIQSLVGPGCDYVVGRDGIDFDAWKSRNDNDDDERELVDESLADIRHAPQGQGVVLWGSENHDDILPALHKSPKLGPFQGRVLLTLDIVPED